MKTNLIGISGKISSGKDATGIILDSLPLLLEGFSVESIVHLVETNQFNSYNFKHKKFADKLKGGCEYDFPNEFSVKEWETGDRSYRDETMSSLGISRREFLLKRGDNCRAIHPDYFVNALFADYIGVDAPNGEWGGYKKYPSWLVTDVRFPNEYDAIKQRGGIVIRVNRPLESKCDSLGIKVIPPLEEDSVLTYEHPSETSLDNHNFDYVINNDGSLSDLIDKVKQLNLV